MEPNMIQIFITMIFYMLIVVGIGVYFAKRANTNSDNYFLGGRSLGPWITAMSAEASDMSGWLLMGLPGVAYWSGIADASWTAIGLALGTYINWLLVAKRLRRYSVITGNAITLPDYLSNRFHENKKVIMTLAAAFILIFFTVYAASCFVTCGKLFSTLFGFSYHSMMIIGALFVIVYTFLGGFLAESASDFMQSIVMVGALVATVCVSVVHAGGLSAVIDNAKDIPGFFNFFTSASPTIGADGKAVVEGAAPVFSQASAYGLLTILSTLSWGLGYFGMPQVLLRFMAIRKVNELTKSRRIATIWVVISMFAAVFIGLAGRLLYPIDLLTKGEAENVFILLTTRLFPPLFAGLAMAGILAATISSSDSYLLIASSAFSKNIYQGIFKKNATDKQVMAITRITLILVSIIGVIIAMDENSVIFKVVSFAWAGFGATFGPIMLFSLFWKRTTKEGAVAGMLSGGIMVFIWKLMISKIGGVFAIYELLPAFLISCSCIVVVSLFTKRPSKIIEDEFEQAKHLEC